MYYVYVLYSEKDKQLYIGQTKDLNRRFRKHKYGKVRSTKSRRPLKLVYWDTVNSRQEALDTELKWKSSSGRRYLRKKIFSVK